MLEALVASVVITSIARMPEHPSSIAEIASFLGIMLLLTAFDAFLARGESMDIAQPVAIGAVFILGPAVAVGMALLARSIAHAFRSSREDVELLMHALMRRVLSLALAGATQSWLLRHPGLQYHRIVVLVVAASAAVLIDAVLVQAYAAARQRRSILRLLSGSLQLRWLMWGGYASVAALTAVLFPEMGIWGLLLMVGLLIVMRQSFSLLLDIRGAYQATMSALAAAGEAHDARRQGHAERVAGLARAIGAEVGLRGREIERLTYASLLHDVDLIGTAEAAEGVQQSRSSEVLADVKFLADVVPVLALCDGRSSAAPKPRDRLLAYIVCRASNVDELITHDCAAVRVYPRELMGSMLGSDEREPVESAVWRLLTAGGKLGT